VVETGGVGNQPPPLSGFDPLACDPALADAVHREGAGDAVPTLASLAELVGSTEALEIIGKPYDLGRVIGAVRLAVDAPEPR